MMMWVGFDSMTSFGSASSSSNKGDAVGGKTPRTFVKEYFLTSFFLKDSSFVLSLFKSA